jgi:mannose-6-phosphate isomerase-like protein (cupin superfamily)
MAAGLAQAATPGQLPPRRPYERRWARLLRTDAYEAWLLGWPSDVGLELHDHGGSAGAFSIVRGDLVESFTDLADGRRLQSRRLEAGDTITFQPSHVHDVWNPGVEETLSVHVYSPPLSAMTFFDHQPASWLRPLRTEAADGPA